ncbi:patatin-like phospholipase family protein [Gorillibacterium sp. sgz5001074]|uniref:patatin-like phospholipase family protein n=1 Tax=Gorillibacterium sp. sgz5001074 TaxID=3446695 RepID=UPI003F67899E
MNEIGLVLEGGGMRGVYTAGVLECFLENGVDIPYVTGVSAGACNAASYISRQTGRNKKVTIDYVTHPRYLSVRNLFREKSLFGWSLIFDEIPNKLVPFDYEAFYGNPGRFWVGMTDALTGETVYAEKSDTLGQRDILTVIQASSSLPFVSPPVEAGGRVLFDGGISDPIPIHKSAADGNKRHVVVLTKPEGYRKKPFKHRWLADRFYPKYPGLAEAMERRYRIYNETLDETEAMEREGQVLLIRPSAELPVGRVTKDPAKLTALYELGFRDAEQALPRLREWGL